MAHNHTTTTSFKDAITMGLPLSSKGAGHAASLPRGQSCLACRRRKVKCDGARPVCGGCAKSAVAHGEDPTTFACPYDDNERPPSKRKRPASSTLPLNALASTSTSTSEIESPTERERELERKLAELEARLAAATSSSSSTSTGANGVAVASGPAASPPFGISTLDSSGAASPSTNFDFLLQASVSHHQETPSLLPNFDGASDPIFVNFSTTTTTTAMGASISDSPDDTLLLELLYPGWPHDLPSPGLVNRLLEVFFNKSHICNDMINKSRFLAAMRLPPMHHNFPHRSLIHAILASTARMVSEDFFEQEEGYWRRGFDGDIEESPAEYHAKRAKRAVDEAVSKGMALFHVQQAMVLLCYNWYTSARFVEVWLGCGLSTRLTGPLGLNHLRSKAQRELEEAQLQLGAYTNRKPALLPPPADDEELFERSTTFWFALIADRFATASTSWPVSLEEDDITSLLPSPNTSLDSMNLDESPLSIKNPNFFTYHPPHLVGSLQLYIKSIILVGRVVTYMQRDGSPTRFPPPPVDPRTTEAFKKLDIAAVQFRLSIPKEYQHGAQSMFAAPTAADNRLCVIHAMPHVATILLHEPFVTMQENDPSLAKCLLSARTILESVYTLWSTSFEIGFLAPFINLAWSIAGRTLVREIAIKQARDSRANVTQLRSDVEVILAAMRAFKTPLGTSVAHALQTLLENPRLALPNVNMTCMPYPGPRGARGIEDTCTFYGNQQSPFHSALPAATISPVSSGTSPSGGTGPSPASTVTGMFEFPTTPNSSNPIDTSLFSHMVGDEAQRVKEMQDNLGRFAEVAGLGEAFGSSWTRAT